MVAYETLIITIIASVFGSTGFWALITTLIQRRDQKENARDKVLLGLAHRQICADGEAYIKQGYITEDEYELQKRGCHIHLRESRPG